MKYTLYPYKHEYTYFIFCSTLWALDFGNIYSLTKLSTEYIIWNIMHSNVLYLVVFDRENEFIIRYFG